MSRNNYIITTKELAEIIGKTEQRVNQLAKEGVLEKVVAGKWDIVNNMKMYIEYLESKCIDEADLEKQKLQAEVDYKRHKADMIKLELAELEGNMHRSEDIEKFVGALIFAYKAQLLSLPGLLAPALVNVNSASEISEKIRYEAVNMLESLAAYDYDNTKYQREVRERQGWSTDEADSEEYGDDEKK